MRLVSAVLGFLLRKLGLVAAVVLSLFLGLLLMSVLAPTLQKAEAGRDRLAEVAERRADLETEVGELRSTYAEAQSRATARSCRSPAPTSPISRGRSAWPRPCSRRRRS